MIQFFSKKRGEKGFTLIELLVVIAIIGILAGIVLVALGGARDRAKDARIKADLAQLRTVGEMFYGTNNSYTNLDGDADEGALATDIAAQGGTYVIRINTTVPADGYCAYSSLNDSSYWCVDGNLKSVADTAVPTNCLAGCVAADTCACD